MSELKHSKLEVSCTNINSKKYTLRFIENLKDKKYYQQYFTIKN